MFPVISMQIRLLLGVYDLRASELGSLHVLFVRSRMLSQCRDNGMDAFDDILAQVG